MALHDDLHSLARQLGTGIFDDSDSFRGALDDFMDENAASAGEINLLADAVRLGAFRRMMEMIASGAAPTAAVEASGDVLARERGTTDVVGSRWAVAILGYAADQVSAADVMRYRTAPSQFAPPLPGEGPPPTAARPEPPIPPASPTWSGPVAGAAGASPAPTGQQPQYPSPGYPPSDPRAQWTPIDPGRDRYEHQQRTSRWPFIVIAVLVLAIIGGGAWYFGASSGDNDSTTTDTLGSQTDEQVMTGGATTEIPPTTVIVTPPTTPVPETTTQPPTTPLTTPPTTPATTRCPAAFVSEIQANDPSFGSDAILVLEHVNYRFAVTICQSGDDYGYYGVDLDQDKDIGDIGLPAERFGRAFVAQNGESTSYEVTRSTLWIYVNSEATRDSPYIGSGTWYTD